MADEGEARVPTREEFIESQVGKVLSIWRGVGTPTWALGEMEDYLWVLSLAHPVGSMLIDRARLRTAPKISGEQAKDGAATDQGGAGTGGAASGG